MSTTQNLVDIEFALSQLSGNSDLLSKMLVKFSDEFSAVPNKIIHALEQNNLTEAKLQVHTTKGLSGNLGLMALYECSKKLDQQIREGNIDQTQVQAFASIMHDTCEFLKIVNLDLKTPKNFSDAKPSINNNEKSIFLERLKHNEFIDDDTLFSYINALSLNEDKKQTLKELVEELQYAKAIDLINEHT